MHGIVGGELSVQLTKMGEPIDQLTKMGNPTLQD